MCKHDNLKQLYNTEEYIKYLKISRSTVSNWIKNKKLIEGYHYIKIGRSLRFFLSDKLVKELHEPCDKKASRKKLYNLRKVRKIDLNR